MKAVLPKPLNAKAFEVEQEKAMKLFLVNVERDFQETVKDWSEPPKVEKQAGRIAAGYRIAAWIFNQVYFWISEGTKDHRVPKTGTATMAFPSAYSPKTAVGRIPSRPGGASGNMIIRTGSWIVSGIKARKYDKQIRKKRERLLWRLTNEAWKRAAKASGHGM